MKRILVLTLAGFAAGGFSFGAAIDLKESKFTQVVNEVEIISTANNAKKPAAVDGIFKLPDVLRTGPASRAELVAEDRTITRVGANTLFSFDQEKRSIHLEKGSILFNSPKGKGGGSIHTAAATAAVIGTTIIVSTTPNGGFKVLTLEGRTDVRYTSGAQQRLEAGQMTFVLPGSVPGPVVMFRLDQQVGGSTLVKGFAKPLPAQAKIEAAVEKQTREIKSGRAEDTGLFVGDEATPTGVKVIKLFDQVSASASTNDVPIIPELTEPVDTRPNLPPGFVVPARLVFNRDEGGFLPQTGTGFLFVSSPAQGTNPAVRVEYSAGPADAALDDQTISGPLTLSDPLVFRESVDVYSVDSETLHRFLAYDSFMGFVGKNITINTPTLDLNPFAPMDHFDFLALEDLHITSSLDISASSIPNGVNLTAGFGHKVLIASGKTLNVDSPKLLITSPAGFTLDSSTVSKETGGSLEIFSDSAVSLNNSVLSGGDVFVSAGTQFSATGTSAAAGGIFGSSAVTIDSNGGTTIGVNVDSDPATGSISLFSSGGVTVNNGARLRAAFVSASSGGGVSFNNASVEASQLSISGGGFFSENNVSILNATFDVAASLSIQNGFGPLIISGSEISAGSLSANSFQGMTFNNSTLSSALGQVNLTGSGAFGFTDTGITADRVRITSGTFNATRTGSALGEIRGNSSVSISASSGLTVGVNVTSGTSPTTGTIDLTSSSGQVNVNPGMTVSAATVRMNSPGGVNVRNSSITAGSLLSGTSRAGVLYDTDAVSGGQVNFTAGDSSVNPLPGAGKIQITASTFDLAGGMNLQNNSGVLSVNNSSRVTAAGTFSANSRGGMLFDNANITAGPISLSSFITTTPSTIQLENSTFSSGGGATIQGDAIALNNTSVSASSDVFVSGSSVTLNNSVLSGQRVTVNSAGFISAPNVAPNNGQISGTAEVNLTSQNGMTVAVELSASAPSGSINLVNNSGILNAGGGKTFQAAFVTVNSPGGLLFDGTTVNSSTRVNLTAGSQPGTLAIVQNTSFTGAADVNIAAHTVVLSQVGFASGSAVNLKSAVGQLAANPNTGRSVQGGFVNFIQGVTYGGQPAENFIGAGITIGPLQ